MKTAEEKRAYKAAWYQRNKHRRGKRTAERKEKRRVYDANNREKKAAADRRYREKHKDEERAYARAYYLKHREKIIARSNERQKNHWEQKLTRARERYAANLDESRRVGREYRAAWRAKNPGKAVAAVTAYYRRNRQKVHKRMTARSRERRKVDVLYRLKFSMWRSMNDYFRRKSFGKKAAELLGCTFPQLKAHIESLFKPGMTWENRGIHGWHIDHVHPISRFDLTDVEQLKKCWHYTNLQPLWALDNIRKGNALPA